MQQTCQSSASVKSSKNNQRGFQLIWLVLGLIVMSGMAVGVSLAWRTRQKPVPEQPPASSSGQLEAVRQALLEDPNLSDEDRYAEVRGVLFERALEEERAPDAAAKPAVKPVPSFDPNTIANAKLREALKNPSVVKTLSLRFERDLTELPSEISLLQNLTALDLTGTSVKSLPPKIGQLKNLKQLTLAATFIKQLPKEIGQLANLEELDLEETQLQSLPAEISNLKKLKKLNVAFTGLTKFPSSMNGLTSLEEIDLEGLNLSEAELSRLRQLVPRAKFLFGE